MYRLHTLCDMKLRKMFYGLAMCVLNVGDYRLLARVRTPHSLLFCHVQHSNGYTASSHGHRCDKSPFVRFGVVTFHTVETCTAIITPNCVNATV